MSSWGGGSCFFCPQFLALSDFLSGGLKGNVVVPHIGTSSVCFFWFSMFCLYGLLRLYHCCYYVPPLLFSLRTLSMLSRIQSIRSSSLLLLLLLVVVGGAAGRVLKEIIDLGEIDDCLFYFVKPAV